ncbi:MAG: hypothetical protein HOI80_00005 [Alphaproteobacteria bacterium]|nr:hypothetical protein [Alphaproteobacteria bacterium]
MVKKKDEVLTYAMSPKTGQTHPGASFNFRMEENAKKENDMSDAKKKSKDDKTARAYKDKLGFIRLLIEVAGKDGTVADLVKAITNKKITSGKHKGKKFHATEEGVRKKLKTYREKIAESDEGGNLPTLKDERAGGRTGADEMARYLAQLQED